MTVGLLIITHEHIGEELVDTATAMLGVCPLATEVLPISRNCGDPAVLLRKAQQLATALEQGNGVLVLTDIYGSTPSNIANRLLDGEQIKVVSGINLPMLIRVLNYPRLNLAELTEKALSGGRDGIISCCPPSGDPG
jgi:PTS system ascorbate-specific IIA component